MKILLSVLTILFYVGQSSAQDKPAYSIYTGEGKKVSYKKMLKTLSEKDIVLFGEYHNNPIVHWLQLETTKDLDASRELVLGAEMFEADNQGELDDYLSGKIDEKALDTLARLWPNYYTDYAPLVNYAKDNKIVFVAANIPRRYAHDVYLGGFEALDTLSDEEKSWIAPLPIKYDSTLSGYKNMLAMMGGHGGQTLPMAQASKDATMAYFILKNYKEGKLFIHYNGAYHSDDYQGILWYLQQEKPNLKYATISVASQSDISKLEDDYKGKADFIICVDEDMTTTH